MPTEEEDLPSHLSDDDDDAKLTHNTKAASDMPIPEKLKKPEPQPKAVQMMRKGSKPALESDEPMTTAQRMEELNA